MRLKWKLTDEDITKIISLYNNEKMPQNQIAKKFNIDHSTVHYHLRKNNVELRISQIKIKPRVQKVIFNANIDFNGEKINLGKTYAEYLQDECKRNGKKYTHPSHISMRFGDII